MVTDTCLIVHYNTYIIELNPHICVFENMDVVTPKPHPSVGVAALRASLAKIFRNYHWCTLNRIDLELQAKE